MRRLFLSLFASAALCWTPSAASAADIVRALDVVSYSVRVTPDLTTRSVTGNETIVLIAVADSARLEFDSGELQIDSAAVNGIPVTHQQSTRQTTLMLPRRAAAGETLRVALRYHGLPKRGVSFFPEAQQIYTVFTTSEWMICLDDPADKSTLDLTVVAPADWTVISHGNELGSSKGDDAVAHRFAVNVPASTYTYGFVAGRFLSDVRERAGTAELRSIATDLAAPQMRQVFAGTADMVAFFEEKAGLPLPGGTYTQVLTAGGAQQELVGFALLPKTYGPWVLAHPEDITLAAHELAHQWWGNSVTCRSWNEFWLNEGMATFMAAAYVEHRFGRDAYDRLIRGYRSDVDRLRAAGHDKPLVFPDWDHPTADDRTVVYRKGAYVLSQLRDALGDDAFWRGIRAYTTRFVGGLVTSDDFRASMEQETGRDLGPFFRERVER